MSEYFLSYSYKLQTNHIPAQYVLQSIIWMDDIQITRTRGLMYVYDFDCLPKILFSYNFYIHKSFVVNKPAGLAREGKFFFCERARMNGEAILIGLPRTVRT